MPIYDEDEIVKSFDDLEAHKRTSDIIISHSSNKRDIREFALESIDLSKVKNILDLGCGFGFFTQGLKGRIKKGTHIVGLDIQDVYQKPFLETCRSIGAIGEFHASDAIELATYPPHSFDLVISSFSLYFFPDAAKHISQILTKNGALVAITHSSDSLSELITHLPKAIKSIGLKVPEILSIQRLFHEFSLENGEETLAPYFKEIEVKPYKNRLIFNKKDIKNIEVYLKMKKHLLLKEIYDNEPDCLGAALDYLMISLTQDVKAKGKLELNKDDAVFICRHPTPSKKKAGRPRAKKFCTFCGNPLTQKLIEDKKRNMCPECGHIVYENPLPVVSAVVVNDKKEVLLVKRAMHPMKGMWCLPSGFAEADEHIEEAVLRELEEETGIKGRVVQLLDADTAHNYFYGNLLMISFEIERIGGKLEAGSDADEVKYFPLTEIPPLAFPIQERALKQLFGLHASDHQD